MKFIDHLRVRHQLYDYLMDEPALSQKLRERVRRHLEECNRCASDLADIRGLTGIVRRHAVVPGAPLSEAWWNQFASKVDRRIADTSRSRRSAPLALGEDRQLIRRWAPRLVLTGLAVGIVAGFFLLGRKAPESGGPALAARSGEAQMQPPIELARMQKYFRRSKSLLIGIENMKIDSDEPVDIGAEQRASRELLTESRYFEGQPLDTRSEKLIADLQKILTELAHMKEMTDLPGVEILRGGIHQENLLFKIRLAEQVYDSTHFVKTSGD
jgi:hypothetical protein